jgi:hypothetical protein
MIDAALRASLVAFDDAALATLANAGLVRRAHRDVNEGKLRLLSAGEGRAVVEADGQLVTLDTRGPRAADCACRSVSVCRHRIAAVLFLRELDEEMAGEEDTSAPPEEIVAAFDPAALKRWAGKANWRAALELMDAAMRIEPSANAIAVAFAELGVLWGSRGRLARARELLRSLRVEVEWFTAQEAERAASSGHTVGDFALNARDHLIGAHVTGKRWLVTHNTRDFAFLTRVATPAELIQKHPRG